MGPLGLICHAIWILAYIILYILTVQYHENPLLHKHQTWYTVVHPKEQMAPINLVIKKSKANLKDQLSTRVYWLTAQYLENPLLGKHQT
jgi:hypothetical protein